MSITHLAVNIVVDAKCNTSQSPNLCLFGVGFPKLYHIRLSFQFQAAFVLVLDEDPQNFDEVCM